MNNVNLDKLVLVNLDIDIWSGQAKLQPSDLKGIDTSDLPPETLASLGSKRICSKEHLKVFNKLKARAVRAVLEHGRPFIGGYAYPSKYTDKLEAKLIQIEQEYLAARQQFLKIYEDAVQCWMDDNPKYSDAIKRGALERDEVGERLNFGFQIIAISPIQSPEAQKRLDVRIKGVGDELVDEIADKANEFLDKYLIGQEAVSTQTKRSLVNMRDKVRGLAFLNRKLAPMGQLLDDMILAYGAYAGKKHVEGDGYFQILASTLVLSNREKLTQYIAGELDLGAMTQKLMPGDSSPVTNTDTAQDLSSEPESAPELDTKKDEDNDPSEGMYF